MYLIERLISYISKFLALIVVLPIHEFAHAFAAVKCGDPTPKLYNRFTINPFAHFDPLGLVCFLFAGFGWAKPVPVNPYNFKHYKSGCFWVSIAGVLANLLLAFFAYPLYILTAVYVPAFGYFTEVLYTSLFYIFGFSISFFVFNLLPIYPLDGFKIIDSFTTRRGKAYYFLRNQGRYILYCLFALSLIADFTGLWWIDVLGLVINTVSGYIQTPISIFWGLFLGGI